MLFLKTDDTHLITVSITTLSFNYNKLSITPHLMLLMAMLVQSSKASSKWQTEGCFIACPKIAESYLLYHSKDSALSRKCISYSYLQLVRQKPYVLEVLICPVLQAGLVFQTFNGSLLS